MSAIKLRIRSGVARLVASMAKSEKILRRRFRSLRWGWSKWRDLFGYDKLQLCDLKTLHSPE